MASHQAIATKRVNAVRTIETASTALAEKFDLEITPLPNVKRFDAEYGRAVQLSHLADTLRKIAIATGAAKDSDFGEEITETIAPDEAVITDEVEIVEQPKKKRGKK